MARKSLPPVLLCPETWWLKAKKDCHLWVEKNPKLWQQRTILVLRLYLLLKMCFLLQEADNRVHFPHERDLMANSSSKPVSDTSWKLASLGLSPTAVTRCMICRHSTVPSHCFSSLGLLWSSRAFLLPLYSTCEAHCPSKAEAIETHLLKVPEAGNVRMRCWQSCLHVTFLSLAWRWPSPWCHMVSPTCVSMS